MNGEAAAFKPTRFADDRVDVVVCGALDRIAALQFRSLTSDLA